MSNSSFVYSGIIKNKMVMSGKKKFKSGKLNAVTEGILIDALKLWQQEFIGEIRKMEADGKRVMFHPNWTAVMLREFGVEFGVEELTNTEPIEK
jgi:hypothetical protein